MIMIRCLTARRCPTNILPHDFFFKMVMYKHWLWQCVKTTHSVLGLRKVPCWNPDFIMISFFHHFDVAYLSVQLTVRLAQALWTVFSASKITKVISGSRVIPTNSQFTRRRLLRTLVRTIIWIISNVWLNCFKMRVSVQKGVIPPSAIYVQAKVGGGVWNFKRHCLFSVVIYHSGCQVFF